MEKPNYSGTGWHIFINLAFGIVLFLIAVLGCLFYHLLMILLFPVSVYFVFNAFKWRKGSVLDEKIKIRNELIKLVQPKNGIEFLMLELVGIASYWFC
jgi:hypothetical protein